MKRATATLALALGLTVSSWTGQAQAKNPECRFGTGVHAMKQTIWCVSHKLRVSPQFRRTALYVADRESHYLADATNAYSGAAGIFQHIQSYWAGRYAAFSPSRFAPVPPSVYNGRTNIIVSLIMAKRGGWGPWAI